MRLSKPEKILEKAVSTAIPVTLNMPDMRGVLLQYAPLGFRMFFQYDFAVQLRPNWKAENRKVNFFQRRGRFLPKSIGYLGTKSPKNDVA